MEHTEPTEEVTEQIEGWFAPDDDQMELEGLDPKDFRVTDRSSLEWVLARIQEQEATIAAIDNTQEVLVARAIIANAEKMKKKAARTRDWLIMRFGQDVHVFVHAALEGCKTRTFETIFGSVSLRKSNPLLIVKDEEKATASVAALQPENIVVTTKIKMSGLPKEWLSEPPEGFTVRPASETCAINCKVEGKN